MTQYSLWMDNSSLLGTLSFGIVNGDPAQGMFSAANFPGASANVLTGAQNLYALLTGRVMQITGDARINEDTGQYESFGVGTQRARMREAGLFIQDSWRWKPNFTVNLGLRYELQMPFYPLNDSFSTATLADLCGISGVNPDTTCNLFQAGVTPGKRPEFINFGKGEPGYNTDYDNFAPSVGMAWTLKGQEGALGTIFGSSEADTVFRAGYTRSFNRNGMNDFSGQYNANPGIVVSTTRSANLGNLGALPVLFRDAGRLGPAPFPVSPVYPMTDVISQDINLFDPDIQVPYADSWTLGWQRAVGRNMAVEARYVGTRARDLWETINYNEINVFDNGFIQEFRAAQANLQANVANGIANQGYAYRGPGTGTVPLPIMFAYFQGAGDPTNSAAYTSSNFRTNTNFLTPLARFD
ncbi:MAG: TonB-dependent receptor domain-containing protein, partial [Longimicrobiales bacterium]